MADHASTALGPKLGQLIYCDIGGVFPNGLRRMLRAYDQLIQGSVKSTALVDPPGAPADGDAYIILQGTTPTGAWAGQAGKVAVYSIHIATTDTNTKVPGWEFYTPKKGWGFFSEAGGVVYRWDGGAWIASHKVGSGTASTSTGTGDLVVVGGAGVGGALYVGTSLSCPIVALSNYISAPYGIFSGPSPTSFGNGTNAGAFTLQGPSGSAPSISFFDFNQVKTRWTMSATLTGNYNFNLSAYDSAGALVDTPIIIPNTAGLAISITRPINLSAGVPSTSTSTGTVIITGSGGLGVGGKLSVGGGAAFSGADIFMNSIGFYLNSGGSTNRVCGVTTNGVSRWAWGGNSLSESGSDAGCAWVLSAFADTGAIIDTPISIARAAGGAINLSRPVQRAGTQVLNTRRVGWAAQTATAARTDLGASPTVGALASAFRALYDDLAAHGLIGA